MSKNLGPDSTVDTVYVGPITSGFPPLSLFHFRVAHCKVIKGDRPLICQRAEPRVPPELLPGLERTWRKQELTGKGETILWVGDQAEPGTLCFYEQGCDCFGQCAEHLVSESEGNFLRLTGEVWELGYADERGKFPANGHKAIGWLARLLASPNRSLSVPDVLGDPDGKLAADAKLRDECLTDGDGIQAIKKRVREIDDLREITGGSDETDEEYADLLRQLDAADRDKKITSSLRKEHHRIEQRIRVFHKKLAGAMPKLFAHLTASLKLNYPEFGYFPSSDSKSWKT